MCGIAGILAPGRAGRHDLEGTARAMADRLAHRGPDGSGVWTDSAVRIALAHRRLAIIELSREGHQPMVSHTGRYVVSFNGEFYNFQELRTELEGRGHSFRGHSDTEVFLTAVEAWGLEGALDRTVGMFSLALWDRQRRRLHLVRDRLGEKPLYYGRVGGRDGPFAFASELRAFHAHPDFAPEMDRASVGLFLRLGYVPAPRAIFAGIRKLPPGTILTVTDAPGPPPEPVPYWSASAVAKGAAAATLTDPDDALVDRLEAVLSQAVGRSMVSDVPLGLFLSGGIDSSTVAALAQARSPKPVRTFTIAFLEEGFDEAGHARAVADHLGTDHNELTATPKEALGVIPALGTIYDEPFADSSQIPTYLVSRMARRHVKVVLSGDGGDELFAGYNRHFLEEGVFRRTDRLPRPLRRAAAWALRVPSRRTWDAAARLVPSLARRYGAAGTLGRQIHRGAGLLPLDGPMDRYRSLTTAWPDGPGLLAGPAPGAGEWEEPSPPQELATFTERAMYLDLVSYLPDDILVKVDRASMACGLETRAPLLNHDVVELAWRIPLSAKVRNGAGKWVLRRVLHRHVPPALVERPKAGFAVPIADWLRDPLREWAEDALSVRELERCGLRPTEIRRTWEDHLSGRRDSSTRLWCVLMLQAWMKENFAARSLQHATAS